MKQILKDRWNLKNPKLKQVEGYNNANFKIEESGNKYILKVYPCKKSTRDWAETENKILLWLNEKAATRFPLPEKTEEGQTFTFDAENRNVFRLLSWLEGNFLSEVLHTPELFASFGKFLAEMDTHLQNYQDYVIEARYSVWDLQHFIQVTSEKMHCFSNPSDRKLVVYILMKYRDNVLPELHKLRKSIIHGDANDRNVLVQNGKISGIIDFGDMCYSQLINELAIGVTYAVSEKENPVKWACYIISGYHQKLALEEREIDLLYWLVAARLCMSVCHSASEKLHQPDNPYITISEKPAWNLLKKWVIINPVFAANSFREAAGFKIHVGKVQRS